MNKLISILSAIILLVLSFKLSAQEKEVQSSPILADSYFEVNYGYIHYPFSAISLESGYTVEQVFVPRGSLRFVLFGYNFNKYISAQISYTRPLYWVRYRGIGTTNNRATIFGTNKTSGKPVVMTIGGLTVKSTLPLGDRFSIYSEAGLAIVTRDGFTDPLNPEKEVLTDAGYASFLFGTGVNFSLGRGWGLKVSSIYSPPNKKVKQPYTLQSGLGLSHTLGQSSGKRLNKKSTKNVIFPKNTIQLGFATNHFGYGVNEFMTDGTVPLFWDGKAEIESGISLQFQRNVFHGRRIFSIDIGSAAAFWQSRETKQQFFTLAIFPVFRFTFMRTKTLDAYLNYSIAGPAFISASNIDGYATGPHFTFQDYVGVGSFFGKARKLNAEIRIGHYSNGNLYAENDGVEIPLTFNVGYTF